MIYTVYCAKLWFPAERKFSMDKHRSTAGHQKYLTSLSLFVLKQVQFELKEEAKANYRFIGFLKNN